jgi:dTDP-L-rhamnose 4-epimerase
VTRALVTGGAGLIGSHIVDRLLQRGLDVTILDVLEPDTHPAGRPAWIPPDVRFVEGDVRDPDAVGRALDGVEVVFHQAAYGGFSPFLRKTVDTNVMGTVTLLDALIERGQALGALVTASSQAVYGEGAYRCPEHGLQFPDLRPLEQLERGEWEMRCPVCGRPAEGAPTPESKPAVATAAYHTSKYFEERITLEYGRATGTHAVALRYALTYGPRQSLFNPYTGITSIFSTLILNGTAPTVYEDGRQTRDFVFVGDVADANLHVAFTPVARGQVFNVGTGVATAVADYARILARVYGSDVEPRLPGEFRPADFRHLVTDASALEAVGFRARTPVEAGVERYVDWIRDQGDVRAYFAEAYESMQAAGIVRGVRA